MDDAASGNAKTKKIRAPDKQGEKRVVEDAASDDARVKKIRAQDVESKDLMKLKSRDEMGHVSVGVLDTNDQEDAGAWGDGEYVDERTGLDLDPKLAKRSGSKRLSI